MLSMPRFEICARYPGYLSLADLVSQLLPPLKFKDDLVVRLNKIKENYETVESPLRRLH
jgi:hypothetical protein